MLAYLSIYVINFFASSLVFKRGGWIVFSVFVCFLVAFLGLRGEGVGVDTAAYYYSFLLIESSGYEAKDPLYHLIVKAVSGLGFGPEMVIFIFSIITIVPISVLIYKESPYPVLSFSVLLAFGFYAFYFNGMRQGASITFGVAFVSCLVRKEHAKALAFLAVSAMLHLSALILLPIYFIWKMPRRSKVYLILCLWPLSILSAFNEAIFYTFLSSIEFLVPARFSDYIQMGDLADKGLSFVFNQIVFLFLLFVFFRVREEKDELYILLGMLGIVLLYLFSGVKYVDRLASYYYIFSVVALPVAVCYIKGSGVRYSLIFFLVLLLGAQFLYRTVADPHFIFPYYTVFNDGK